jgi:hypothetical protein
MKIEKAQGTIHLTGFNKNFVNEVLLDWSMLTMLSYRL